MTASIREGPWLVARAWPPATAVVLIHGAISHVDVNGLQIMTAVTTALRSTWVNIPTRALSYALVPDISRAQGNGARPRISPHPHRPRREPG